jgi:cytochrome c oxidase subunit II
LSRSRARRVGVACLALALALAETPCRGARDPPTPEASRIETLWWVMLGISIVVFIIVVALLAYALFRPRGEHSALDAPNRSFLFVTIGGGAIPLVILAVVFAYSIVVMAQSQPDDPDRLRIDVTARQFAYEVTYPDGTKTMNELRLPVGREVELSLHSIDVIHSFWVPQLNGKTDFVPGITNHMSITPTRVGTYRGQCGEFCGVGHADMVIRVIVEEPAAFARWLDEQSPQPAEVSR